MARSLNYFFYTLNLPLHCVSLIPRHPVNENVPRRLPKMQLPGKSIKIIFHSRGRIGGTDTDENTKSRMIWNREFRRGRYEIKRLQVDKWFWL